MTGYISIQRKLREHWLYKEDRAFSKFEAWIDILYEVNHTDNKFLFDGSLVEVKRGSTITSLRKMSEKWKWSITKVNTFLKMLEEDEMLIVKKDTKKTLLTVVNYDFYQSEKCKKEQQSNTEVTQKRQQSNTEVTQKETNNNELIITNNELKENIYMKHFNLVLTKIEYENIIAEYPKDIVDETIDAINNTSKKYCEGRVSFNLLLRNWVKRNYKLNKTENKSNEVVKDDMDTSKIAEELRRRGL